MTKEEFETWVEQDGHIQEAFDRLPLQDRNLGRWLKLFVLTLNSIAKEEDGEEPEEDEDGLLSDELDDDLDTDDEDEEEEED